MLIHTAIKYIQVKKKYSDLPVTVTTWQSIYKLDRKFFEDYEVVIGDETINLSLNLLLI